MGHYTDSSKVQDMLKSRWVYSASSTVTMGDIDDWVKRYEAIIHGYLVGRNYSPIPVTDTTAKLMLQGAVTMKVAGEVYMLTHQDKFTPDFVKSWLHEWDVFTRDLRKGELILPGNTEHGGIRVGSINLGTNETE